MLCLAGISHLEQRHHARVGVSGMILLDRGRRFGFGLGLSDVSGVCYVLRFFALVLSTDVSVRVSERVE